MELIRNHRVLRVERPYTISILCGCRFLELAGKGYSKSAESQGQRGDGYMHGGSNF